MLLWVCRISLRPSGLMDDQWRDLWWNLWAMTDARSSLEDYIDHGLNYDTEAGESKAHNITGCILLINWGS